MDRRELVGLVTLAAPALGALRPDALEALALRSSAPRARSPQSPVSSPPVLDPRQRATADQVAELIMPATDTPGARAAGVIGFIEVIVGEWYHDDERAGFLRGLADVDARSQSLWSKPFLEATEPQQTAILAGLEAEARAMPPGSPTHFWTRIKGLTIYAYYNSEVGQREELRATFMPGRYDGNAPLPVRAAAPAGGR